MTESVQQGQKPELHSRSFFTISVTPLQPASHRLGSTLPRWRRSLVTARFVWCSVTSVQQLSFLSAPEAKFGQFCGIEAQPGRNVSLELTASQTSNCKKSLEARVGIEPTHKGFADLSLTTWVPRPCSITSALRLEKSPCESRLGTKKSGAGDGI